MSFLFELMKQKVSKQASNSRLKVELKEAIFDLDRHLNGAWSPEEALIREDLIRGVRRRLEFLLDGLESIQEP